MGYGAEGLWGRGAMGQRSYGVMCRGTRVQRGYGLWGRGAMEQRSYGAMGQRGYGKEGVLGRRELHTSCTHLVPYPHCNVCPLPSLMLPQCSHPLQSRPDTKINNYVHIRLERVAGVTAVHTMWDIII